MQELVSKVRNIQYNLFFLSKFFLILMHRPREKLYVGKQHTKAAETNPT